MRRQARASSVLEELHIAPHRFGFDAALRILARAGGRADPSGAARFRTRAGLAYPSATILGIAPGREEQAPEVTTGFFGLTGAAGVLPRFYNEVLVGTVRNRSVALHDFVDMLGQRMAALYAKAGTKYRLHRAMDVAAADPSRARDPVTEALLALSGHGTPGLVERVVAGADPLLHYAGLLAMRPRSADRLAGLLSDWLGREVEVCQFAGTWLAIPPDQRTRIGSPVRLGAWNGLGTEAGIGVRAWDVQARVVIRIGPLDASAFERFLPDRLPDLVSIVRAFLGGETDFAIQPVLASACVRGARLTGGGEQGDRLGWNTWLPTSGRRHRDGDEPLFEATSIERVRPASPH